jgi:hypothetical protein
MSQILCLIETKIHHATINMHKSINSSNYWYVSIHNSHGLMMIYDIHMYLNSFNTITNDGSKYLTTFNINTHKCVYGIRSCLVPTFLNKLQIIIQHSLEHY